MYPLLNNYSPFETVYIISRQKRGEAPLQLSPFIAPPSYSGAQATSSSGNDRTKHCIDFPSPKKSASNFLERVVSFLEDDPEFLTPGYVISIECLRVCGCARVQVPLVLGEREPRRRQARYTVDYDGQRGKENEGE